MCTRYALEKARVKTLAASLGLPGGAADLIAPVDRHNIAPGAPIAALRSLTGVFRPSWGLRAAGDPAAPLVNARAETLAQKPAFREAFLLRRCLVPASGFYEWEKRGRARLPWLFRMSDGGAFCFAALWEKTPGGENAAVIVTTAANALMAPIHHRMPALLADAEACHAWLDPQTDADRLAALLAPAPAGTMSATPVTPRVNRPDFDSPECVAPVVHGLAARDVEAELHFG